MNNTWVWIVVVAIVIVGGFIWWQSTATDEMPSGPTPTLGENTVNQLPVNTSTSTATSTSGTSAPMTATVTYSASGFSPSQVTIKKGGTITFVDDGTDKMWVASGPHPAHTGYDDTDRAEHCAASYSGPAPFDQCSNGTRFSFKFDEVGTWPYHNHSDASDFGRVVVVE